MKSNYLFISIIICTLYICGTQKAVAQKVYKDENNKIILDCGPDSGFPQEAVTTVTGQKTITPSATGLGEDNSDTGSINATVFYKLEIDAKDLDGTNNWVGAYNACKNKGTAANGEIWRLPTQKELMLMYVFRTAIAALGGTMNTSSYNRDSYYWSCTEIFSTEARYLAFYKGYVYKIAKSESIRVRCVREIPMPVPADL